MLKWAKVLALVLMMMLVATPAMAADDSAKMSPALQALVESGGSGSADVIVTFFADGGEQHRRGSLLDADQHALRVDVERPLEVVQDPLGDLHDVPGARYVRQNDRELVATEVGHRVGRPHRLGNALGGPFEDLVADLMAELEKIRREEP